VNYLYGKLNKELEYVKYSGEDTDTVNITVDNTDNIIKADIVRTPKTLTIHNNIYDSYDSFNGAYDTLIELPNYEIEQEDSPEGSLLIYDFKLNGEVISKIRIPYDKDIFNIELDVCVEDDNPLEGLHVGDPYLKITVEDGHGSSTYKYISLASLVYKAGDSIKIENNIISVDLDNGKLSDKLNSIEQNIAQTQSELNAHTDDKTNPHQVTQQQVGIYTYKNIEASFEEKQGNESYPCAADIELEAIKDDTQIPNIYFSKEQVDSGNYAPYCETYFRPSNVGEIINPISVGDNLGGAGFFVTDEQPDFSLLDWSTAQYWENLGFTDSAVIESTYKSPKYITLISSNSDPSMTVKENTIRVCYFEQEFRAQSGEDQWYFPAETYAVIMPGFYQYILYASKESWDPYGNRNAGGYKGIGWGGPFYDATNKKFVVFGEDTSSVTYILYETINYVDSQQDIWGKWITKDKHYVQTQNEINLKENESTSIIYLYLPSNDEGILKLVHELETLDWDNPDKSGTNPYLGDYKIINFFTVSDSIGTSRPYCVYQFKIEYEDHSQYQIAYAIGFENTDSFNWVSWGGTPSSALDFDSIVTISNIQNQEIWGPYISNCNRSIKRLAENDIIDKFIFDVSWEWNFYYNVFDRLNWNSPDETITESDYLIKKIHIFKYGDKYASICKQIGVSSSEVRRYFIQLYAYWGEYTAYLNNNKYSQHWDDFEYTPDSPVAITEIKHQEIWGSAIGKKDEIKEAGYYLKAYSKEAGKITIPAITLQ
jgi:hypothetical protein